MNLIIVLVWFGLLVMFTRMVVAEETEKILMRTAQDEDQKDVV